MLRNKWKIITSWKGSKLKSIKKKQPTTLSTKRNPADLLINVLESISGFQYLNKNKMPITIFYFQWLHLQLLSGCKQTVYFVKLHASPASNRKCTQRSGHRSTSCKSEKQDPASLISHGTSASRLLDQLLQPVTSDPALLYRRLRLASGLSRNRYGKIGIIHWHCGTTGFGLVWLIMQAYLAQGTSKFSSWCIFSYGPVRMVVVIAWKVGELQLCSGVSLAVLRLYKCRFVPCHL